MPQSISDSSFSNKKAFAFSRSDIWENAPILKGQTNSKYKTGWIGNWNRDKIEEVTRSKTDGNRCIFGLKDKRYKTDSAIIKDGGGIGWVEFDIPGSLGVAGI